MNTLATLKTSSVLAAQEVYRRERNLSVLRTQTARAQYQRERDGVSLRDMVTNIKAGLQ